MNSIRKIRRQLGKTQAALAGELGITQGNVSHYEKGQDVPRKIAQRLIQVAQKSGLRISFDEIYAPALVGQEPGSPSSEKAEAT